jgi:hypothetical protein
VWGFGLARLVWPEGLEECLPPEGQRAVLVHELAHLRRRDHWVGWLLLVAGCVWWWHPLFWLVRRRLHCEAELACDAWVVGSLPEARRAYAEALIEVSRLASRPAVPVPALGAAGRRRDFERRLVMILRERMSCRLSRRVLLGVGLLALLALPAWTLGQPGPAKPDPKATPPAEKLGSPKPEKPDLDKVLVDLDKDGALDVFIANELQVPAAPADRDKKLQEVEEKLKALLKEVQALRAGNPPKPNPNLYKGELQWEPVIAQVDLKDFVTRYEVSTRDRGPVEVTLSRTTYQLPAAKAAALAAFLKEHVKASVMETKAEGDSLTVTTTPDAQRTIGQFVALIQGKSAPAYPAKK